MRAKQTFTAKQTSTRCLLSPGSKSIGCPRKEHHNSIVQCRPQNFYQKLD